MASSKQKSIASTSSSSMRTRQLTEHSLYGFPCDLPRNVLPTNSNVARYFLHLKSRPNESNNDKYKLVAEGVMELWNAASIPTIQYQSIFKRVAKLLDDGSSLCRSKSSCKLRDKYVKSLPDLFDIAACSCPITHDLRSAEFNVVCTCSKDKKVPKQELPFLLDQRTCRKMFIGGLDIQTTSILQKRQKRKLDDEERRKKVKQTEESACKDNADHESTENSQSDKESSDHDKSDNDGDNIYICSSSTSQMRTPLSNLAMEAERFGISDRAAASLASAVLVDFGIITKEDASCVIDRSKVRRERSKLRKLLRSEAEEVKDNISGIYFDGRRDKTV